MIEPLRYLIQPIAYERDDETGRVIREIPGQVVTVYTANQAADAVMEFENALKQLTTEGAQDAQPGIARGNGDTPSRSPAGGVRQS
jgi:Ser/Thr protein kinase RdoA (MazF antagonist)